MLEISLQELAAALEKTDVLQGYADTRDGRIILMGEDESDARTEAASREEERMERLLSIEEDWQRYVPLPDIYDAEIRSIMQTFAEKVPQEARVALKETLRGASARLRFRRAVQSLSLAAAWQAHLSSSLLALARDWCEENAIAYRE